MKNFLLLLLVLPAFIYSATVVYTTSAQGKRGLVTLSVTFNGNQISDIQVVSSKEDATYAFRRLIPQIINQNSTQVDTVSGATMTSRALITAVNKAIAASRSSSSVPIAE